MKSDKWQMLFRMTAQSSAAIQLQIVIHVTLQPHCYFFVFHWTPSAPIVKTANTVLFLRKSNPRQLSQCSDCDKGWTTELASLDSRDLDKTRVSSPKRLDQLEVHSNFYLMRTGGKGGRWLLNTRGAKRTTNFQLAFGLRISPIANTPLRQMGELSRKVCGKQEAQNIIS